MKKNIFRFGEKKSGVSLLLTVSILAAIASISFAMFTIVYSQIRIAGELADSFVAFYAADEGIEYALYQDRSSTTACSNYGSSCFTYGNPAFLSQNALSGGCFYASLDKTDSGQGYADNRLTVTGQSRCAPNVTRFVRRSFDLIYTGPPPGAPPGPSLPPGNIAYWPFDETSGTTAADASGSGNNGTLVNFGASPWVAGRVNNALDFDGVNDVVNAGSADAFDNMAAMTVAAWVYPRGYGENSLGRIVDKADTTAPTSGWTFNLASAVANGVVFTVDFSSTDLRRRTVAGAIPFNQWTHVAVTWDGSTVASGVHIYVNGVEAAYSLSQNSSGVRVSDAAEDVKIGNDKSTSRTFNGLIDDVQMYNRVLSASEIASIFNSAP